MAGNSKASLGELMGRESSKQVKNRDLTLDDLSDLLGDGMIKLDFNNVGRFRLITALKGRFGNGFRNVPGISNIIKDFDGKKGLELKKTKLKNISLSKLKGMK